jgi:hypothetical protein
LVAQAIARIPHAIENREIRRRREDDVQLSDRAAALEPHGAGVESPLSLAPVVRPVDIDLMRHSLIYGAGRLHRVPTARKRQRILAAALDAGLCAFDVAPAYGNGIGELEVGLALRGRRHHSEINTKFGIPVPEYAGWARHAMALRRLADKATGGSARGYGLRDFSPDALEISLEGSLRRLRTDYVDALFIHEPLAPIPAPQLAGLVERAEQMKRRGKIRAFGVAGPLESVTRCPVSEGIDVVQTRWPDVSAASRWAPGKPLIAYGTYGAYRESGSGAGFEAFVHDLLAAHDSSRAIVSSHAIETVRRFGEITA